MADRKKAVRTRRAFGAEFKLEAVQRADERRRAGVPLTQIARDLGITDHLLRSWKRQIDARDGRESFRFLRRHAFRRLISSDSYDTRFAARRRTLQLTSKLEEVVALLGQRGGDCGNCLRLHTQRQAEFNRSRPRESRARNAPKRYYLGRVAVRFAAL